MVKSRPVVLAVLLLSLLVSVSVVPTSAGAIKTNIKISGTGGDGVRLRSAPNTTSTTLAIIPEGASPDYVCFTYGTKVGNVSVWFKVNYKGKTGFYASFYDNSSYRTEAELTKKYGVPKCGATPAPKPPTPTPSPKSIYYSPYNNDTPVRVPASLIMYYNAWTAQPSCTMSNADNFASSFKPTLLAGWSIGRLGPIYLLSTRPDLAANVRTVLLLDPGSLSWFRGGCDQQRAPGAVLQRWLASNASNRLIVIAGRDTADYSNRDSSGRGHQGLQQIWFKGIHGTPQASQVIVCNYDGMSHSEVVTRFAYLVNQPFSSRGSCPASSGYPKPAGWGPAPVNSGGGGGW